MKVSDLIEMLTRHNMPDDTEINLVVAADHPTYEMKSFCGAAVGKGKNDDKKMIMLYTDRRIGDMFEVLFPEKQHK